MTQSFALPGADEESVRKAIRLHREQTGVELPYDEAKQYLERPVSLIFHVEVASRLEEAGVPIVGESCEEVLRYLREHPESWRLRVGLVEEQNTVDE
jgi:hypothetical protein